MDTVEAARAALRTFFRIATAWELTSNEQELLLDADEITCSAWRQGQITGALPGETLERVSCVLNIYAALQNLLPIAERADAWVRQPNLAPLLGGAPAICMLTSGQLANLKAVVGYLATEEMSAPGNPWFLRSSGGR